ncbi:hypothetical protein N9I91_02310 [Candidatus Pseudothioglobus singularis]|jgi:hypothetical protein|nr:hypothetical protein [Candidatus Pseudothioglobus singularis]MDA8854969.1 hypothetical protein [Candidatus Pseudothioglobus singularis]
MKVIKLLVIFVFIYFITSSFFNWLIEDSKEIKELIKQGYLPSDWTHEDIFKLCNPETDEEKAARKNAPNYAWTCLIRGGWS